MSINDKTNEIQNSDATVRVGNSKTKIGKSFLSKTILVASIFTASALLFQSCAFFKSSLFPSKRDFLKNNGMVIYEGNTPPNIEGTFFTRGGFKPVKHGAKAGTGCAWVDPRMHYEASPGGIRMTFTYGTGRDGKEAISARIVIQEQRGALKDLQYDNVQLTGSGNNFTAYMEPKGLLGAGTGVHIVLSGTMAGDRITQLHYGYYYDCGDGRFTWRVNAPGPPQHNDAVRE